MLVCIAEYAYLSKETVRLEQWAWLLRGSVHAYSFWHHTVGRHCDLRSTGHLAVVFSEHSSQVACLSALSLCTCVLPHACGD